LGKSPLNKIIFNKVKRNSMSNHTKGSYGNFSNAEETKGGIAEDEDSENDFGSGLRNRENINYNSNQ
jgi:hypothetical protein